MVDSDAFWTPVMLAVAGLEDDTLLALFRALPLLLKKAACLDGLGWTRLPTLTSVWEDEADDGGGPAAHAAEVAPGLAMLNNLTTRLCAVRYATGGAAVERPLELCYWRASATKPALWSVNDVRHPFFAKVDDMGFVLLAVWQSFRLPLYVIYDHPHQLRFGRDGYTTVGSHRCREHLPTPFASSPPRDPRGRGRPEKPAAK